MITKEVIKTLYKNYSERPDSVDCLDMSMLFETVGSLHNISVDIDTLMLKIGSIDSRSMFHDILLSHIHAFVLFDEWVAVVLRASIIFLSRTSTSVYVHVKQLKPTLLDCVRGIFAK